MPAIDAVIVATFGSADDNVRKIFDALVADVRQSFPTKLQLGMWNLE